VEFLGCGPVDPPMGAIVVTLQHKLVHGPNGKARTAAG
jgi:hypothetical protein